MIYNTCCFVSLLILIMLSKAVEVSNSESDTSIVRYALAYLTSKHYCITLRSDD